MADPMVVDGPGADPMAVDDQPSAAGAGDSVRNQELLAKIAALEEKAANDAKTITDLNAEKEAAAKIIIERDETIKTLTADKAALTMESAELRAANTALLANNTALLTNNTALSTSNTALSTSNTTNTAVNERNSKSHKRVIHLMRYFKKGFIRESHMRHKSDGRHGAACGKRVKKLQE